MNGMKVYVLSGFNTAGMQFTIKFIGPHRTCKLLKASFDRHMQTIWHVNQWVPPESIINLNQSGTEFYVLENISLFGLPRDEQ